MAYGYDVLTLMLFQTQGPNHLSPASHVCICAMPCHIKIKQNGFHSALSDIARFIVLHENSSILLPISLKMCFQMSN